MRLMRLNEVMEVTGLARSTVYKYVAAGQFPEPVSLGGRSVAWVGEEVDE
jgi:prophage regulatory protein